MDLAKLTTDTPLLAQPGLISIPAAADLIGLTAQELLGEMLQDRAAIHVTAANWSGWRVPDLSRVDRDDDGAFIYDHDHGDGRRCLLSDTLRCHDSKAAISALLNAAALKIGEHVYELPGSRAGFFLDWDDQSELAIGACMASKEAIERIRARLASYATAAAVSAAKSTTAAPSSPIAPATEIHIYDPITAKHGKMRLSALFADMQKVKKWKPDTASRMQREVGHFLELMGDPMLRDIDRDMIRDYEQKLLKLPTDIRRARIKLGTQNLNALISAVKLAGFATKTSDAVARHISTIGEVFSWGVNEGKLIRNYAANFSKGKRDHRRAQDGRDIFSEAELHLIFSASHFISGTGKFSNAGDHEWRPYQYWLPLLCIYTGARPNEISQLNLSDIVKSECGTWYFDISGLVGVGNGSPADKSLKTANAVRVIPIHEHLIKLGFIEYYEALVTNRQKHLFPELTRDAIKGPGKAAGKWFNSVFLGDTLAMERNGRKSLYSFRHIFSTELDRLEFQGTVIDQLMGHQRGESLASNRYRKDRDADMLSPYINKLKFSCVEHVAKFNTADGLKSVNYALGLKKQGRGHGTSAKDK